MSDIETQDKQWDRDNKRGGRDQRDHDKARPKKPDHGDNRDHKGKEAIPRNNTEERSKGSRKRTEEQGKSSKHHTEERGKSSRSYTEDTKGSRKREEEHDESSRRHTEERGKGSRSHTGDTKARDRRHTSSKKANESTSLDHNPDNAYNAAYQPVIQSYVDSESSNYTTNSGDYSHQKLPTDDTSDPIINWGHWVQLPKGLWHREGQDSLGNWFQEDRYDDPNAPGPSRRGNWFEGSHYEDTPEQSLDTGDGYQDTEVEDLIQPMQTLKLRNDNRNKDPRVPKKLPESFIHWEDWILLENGQWYRRGQSSSGEWYEDYQDDEPQESHQTAS